MALSLESYVFKLHEIQSQIKRGKSFLEMRETIRIKSANVLDFFPQTYLGGVLKTSYLLNGINLFFIVIYFVVSIKSFH